MALENNFNLKSSQEQILSAEDMMAAYKTNYLPNFSVTGNYYYSTSNFLMSIDGGYLPTYLLDQSTGQLTPNLAGFDIDGNPLFKEYAYMPDQNFDFEIGSVFNAGVQLTQAIYLGGKVQTSVKLAKLNVEANKLNQEKTQSEVIMLTDEAFYTLIKVEQLALSAQKYEQAVDEFHRQASNAVDKGMARRNDLLKVEVKLNEAKLLSLKARNALILSKMNLCQVIGIPITTSNLGVKDDFQMGININSTDLDISKRPEYSLLKKQVEAKELEVSLAKSEFLPSITALASYGYTNGVKLNNSTLMNSASFSGGVMLSVPIFHWGEGKRKISASRREVNIAQNQLEDLNQKMSLELMQTITNYQEAIAKVALSEHSLTQAEENMRISGNLYEVGMETIADHLEAQALWRQSMSEVIEAKASQRLSYSRYLKASGLGF